MSKYLQHRQILDCEYKEGFATEYIPFRTAQYAAVLTGFNLHQGLALIVADSGCNTSLVGKTFLDNYVPEAQYTTIPPLDVGGIVAKVTGEQWAIFSLLVPAQIGNRRVSCRVQVKALVISRLKAGLLLGTDNMMPERVIIDLDEKRLIFNGHKQAMTPLHPMQKPGTSVPHKVRAQQDVLLAPNKDYSISFWENSVRPKWMRSDCDYLFNPNHTHISLYVSVLDWDSRRVIARNSGPSSYLLKRGECLGTIVEMPPMKAMIADGNKESALEGGQEAIKAPPLNPGTDEEQQVLPNGITIAGSAGRRLRLAKVVEEFQQVWVNDGKLVEIPMRYWMTVPLKEGARFPKHAKPYPYGPEASKTVDSTMDELQDSNKVSWSTGHTPSAFPLFVTYREVEKEGVLVKKPRVVVDIRKLNEITEPDVYPTQQQDDLLRRIAGKQFLSVFDAAKDRKSSMWLSWASSTPLHM
ncbi:hypothetical protein AAP_04735 [Ascosphaera apis ARSEF 7405]|uniref:Uncharacterized protein n=1 Tax=Ascosphaera apis ARSEF 7405 TaxID=392613 RepID=A0A167WBK7_9EURO|nr:hypothetical protein AAP_04735 [Ascosphaera apis ARSEF 7405]